MRGRFLDGRSPVHLRHILTDTVSESVVLLLLDPVPDKGKGVLLCDPKALSLALMYMFLEDTLLRSTCDLYALLIDGLMSDICEILDALVPLRDVPDVSARSDVY